MLESFSILRQRELTGDDNGGQSFARLEKQGSIRTGSSVSAGTSLSRLVNSPGLHVSTPPSFRWLPISIVEDTFSTKTISSPSILVSCRATRSDVLTMCSIERLDASIRNIFQL
jgi:hypothetical protein